jgi:peptidyl-prolyl cis-trans isomerase C
MTFFSQPSRLPALMIASILMSGVSFAPCFASDPHTSGKVEAAAPSVKEDKPVENKPDAKNEVKPDAKNEVKPDAKTEAKPDAKTEAKPDAKTEAKPDAKTEAKPDAKTEVKPDAKTEVKPDAKTEVKADAKTEVKADAGAKVTYKVDNQEKTILAGKPIFPDPQKNESVAKVGTEEIKDAEVRAAYMATPYRFQKQPIEGVYEQILEQLMDQRMITQAAKKEGLDKDASLQQQMVLATEGVLRDAYLLKKVEAASTPEVLQKRYQDFLKEYKAEEEIHARHILVKTEEEAKKAYDRVEKGEDFVKVAKELSGGMPGGENGGDLGYFTKNRMVKPFAETAFGMKAGEISKPVQTQFGWHVIKVEDRRMKKAPEFAEMENRFKAELANQTVEETLENLKKSTKTESLLKRDLSGK